MAPAPGQVALVERGKVLYSEQHYEQAATLFNQAVDACSCRLGSRNSTCLCKTLIPAIEKQSLKKELKKQCICSARSSTRCPDPAHLSALDSLAAIQEQQRQFDRAAVYAEQMINLSPRDPKGYLRLGKALRLKKQHMLAYLTYDQGISLVSEKSPAHSLLTMLQEQRQKMKSLIRNDPVAKLPLELVVMIFTFVDFPSLCRSLRVSKNWKSCLTAEDCHELWRRQDYHFRQVRHRYPVRVSSIRSYAAFAGYQVTDLCIHDCSRFDLTESKFQLILRLCPKLKNLTLLGNSRRLKTHPPDYLRNNPLPITKIPKLNRLYAGYGVELGPALLYTILMASKETLEELFLFDVLQGPEWPYTEWPPLPKLKILCLASPATYGLFRLSLDDIRATSPNVEELWLDEIAFLPDDTPRPWNRLRSLFIGSRKSGSGQGQPLPMVCVTHNIRELYLTNVTEPNLRTILTDPESDGKLIGPYAPVPLVELGNLEKMGLLEYRDPISREMFETLIQPGIISESLTELELRPFPFAHVDLTDPDMGWFKSESITMLSVTGLSAEAGRSIKNADDTLLNLVDRFPNLVCLDIDRENIENATLGKIVRRGVRTIYHLTGYLRDEVKHWAAKEYGAKVMNGPYPHSPAQHPDRHSVQRRLNPPLRRPYDR
ncbi:hypothetical protein F4778DRAFT_761490 [Xylariomycetidae sp. FL2044]|nr:hypothetical protein F4778DRAFT_761490 [Xylariomycetidae sp. FL2044]